MKLLITGFDPFGGENINPSFEAVKVLKDEINGVKIVKKELPTVFGKSIKGLKMAIEEEKPDFVLCIGQAGGRFDMTVERVAINLDNARIPDNENNQPIDMPVYPEGENAYFTNLPVNAMVENMKINNIPASVSYTAGTFVCNHIFYGLMHLINTEYSNIKGGFIHVPFFPEQIIDKRNTPFMTRAMIVKGLEIALETIVSTREDIVIVNGEIS